VSIARDTKEDRTAELTDQIVPAAPWRVVSVKVEPNYRLEVRFVDGTAGHVDIREMVASREAGVFEALRDPDVFSRAYVSLGSVTWPGELDLAPDAMYDEIKAHGEWVLR
jgi:hypothetical protein